MAKSDSCEKGLKEETKRYFWKCRERLGILFFYLNFVLLKVLQEFKKNLGD